MYPYGPTWWRRPAAGCCRAPTGVPPTSNGSGRPPPRAFAGGASCRRPCGRPAPRSARDLASGREGRGRGAREDADVRNARRRSGGGERPWTDTRTATPSSKRQTTWPICAAHASASPRSKAGWDALRHYEIAGNGAVPCFRDLDRKPPRCAPHGLRPGVQLPSLPDADQLFREVDAVRNDRYAKLATGALAWARQNTTVRRAGGFPRPARAELRMTDPAPCRRNMTCSTRAVPAAWRSAAARCGCSGTSSPLLLSLVSVPFMTRHLGVVDYGHYVTVSSIIFIIGGLTEAGLTNLGTREYSVLEAGGARGLPAQPRRAAVRRSRAPASRSQRC